MKTLCDKINDVIEDTTNALLERDHTVYLAWVAMVSREHFVQLSEPGTAKSELVRQVKDRIKAHGTKGQMVDANYFEYLMTEFTTPDELFGPVDLQRYSSKGEYTRITNQSALDSEVVFLDEIFKANSAVLNALLSLTNERTVHQVGMPSTKAPLLSMFAASNEMPGSDDEEEQKKLRALWDRFMIRQVVQSCQEEVSFERLVQRDLPLKQVNATVTIDDVMRAQEEASKITMSPEALQKLKNIKVEFENNGVWVSDRSWYKIGGILQAVSWLRGGKTIEICDLEILANVAWNEPEQIDAVERIVFAIANPLHLTAIEKEDQAREVYNQMPELGDNDFRSRIENVLQQLVDIYSELKQAHDDSPNNRKHRSEQALSKIQQWHAEAAGLALQHESKLALSL
jgi:MoxR-like ATPase